MFSKLKRIAKQKNYREFIKLYDKSYGLNKIVFALKSQIKLLFRRNTLTLQDILNGLITGQSVPPDEYRSLIAHSRVIFDTQASYQDGLTARFMWALGAGKKIITTNPHVREYDFYNEDQFYVLDNNINEIEGFISKPFVVSELQRKMIEPYRIDNWLKTILKITK